MIVSKLENIKEIDFNYPSVIDTEWFAKPADEWLRSVIAVHFNPESGSKYWLDKEKTLGINAGKDINTIEDLKILGSMDEDALRRFPIEHFIPKSVLKNKKNLIIGETSGTTGKPKVTAYQLNEFYSTFVDFFGYVAMHRNFPVGVNWLWVGPSGPHIIGKAVGHVARRMGSMDPFSIDFDPRWAKKLRQGSFSSVRYLEHVIAQALDLLKTQNIEVIFSTPVVLKELASQMSETDRLKIKGVHYGGIAIDKDEFKEFKESWFSDAVHISGYGNTLFGLCLEIESSLEYDLDYFPPGPRMIPQVVSIANGLKTSRERLSQIVDYGETGQIVFHRLDESFFIPNMFERDQGIRIAPTENVKALGLNIDGVRNPELLEGVAASVKVGLY